MQTNHRPIRRSRVLFGALALLTTGLIAGDVAAQGIQRPGRDRTGPVGPNVPAGPGGGGGGGAPAGDLVVAQNPQQLLDIMTEHGWTAKMGTDSYGDPMIEGEISQSSYTIFFYGCTDNKDCRFIQFFSGWDLTNGISLDQINDWNKDKLFGTAYRDDEDDPLLSIVVNLEGGVSRDNFISTLDWFQFTLEEFETHIGWQG